MQTRSRLGHNMMHNAVQVCQASALVQRPRLEGLEYSLVERVAGCGIDQCALYAKKLAEWDRGTPNVSLLARAEAAEAAEVARNLSQSLSLSLRRTVANQPTPLGPPPSAEK